MPAAARPCRPRTTNVEYHQGGIVKPSSPPYTRCMMLMTSTVFIIDDDASARAGLTRLVQAAGYEAQSYAHASDFLTAVVEAPACVVLDMRMPGLGGADVMSALAAKGVSFPVIIVTADEEPGMRHRMRERGAVALFRKPVDGPALLDAIAWALESITTGQREQIEQ